MYYIGLDVHKKTISFCIKDDSGKVFDEGTINASRTSLDAWITTLPRPWHAALEATLFTGWIYDHLRPHADQISVAHPAMLKAIACAKRKNDQLDAAKIADLLRCDILPACYMAPQELRDKRRTLRYRNLLVRQSTQTKNRTAGLLMETGVTYAKSKLHQRKYFAELLESNPEVAPSIKPLLRISRATIEQITKTDLALLGSLKKDPLLKTRIERLTSIPGVGLVTALTWALETGEVQRFASLKQAVSYCGLCGSEKSSAGIQKRTPISKQRNKHLQTVLVEAAKLAPRYNHELALVYDREKQKGNCNRATLAVARKLVAFLLAVDRREQDFQIRLQTEEVA